MPKNKGVEPSGPVAHTRLSNVESVVRLVRWTLSRWDRTLRACVLMLVLLVPLLLLAATAGGKALVAVAAAVKVLARLVGR